jgi:hypothetical protein
MIPCLAVSQRHFQVVIVNEKTSAPMGMLYCHVIKNNDQLVANGFSDNWGIYKFRLSEFDSTATYQIEILNRGQNVKSGRHKINLINENSTVVKVTPISNGTDYTCPRITYFNYFPKELYSIVELPKSIQLKVKSQLIGRVGKSFFKTIKLNGGQIINLERFYLQNPDAKTNGYVPHSYSLCFMIIDSNTGASFYSFNLTLDEHGDLTSKINLPDIGHNAKKTNIIPISYAILIAKRNMFYDKQTKYELKYDEQIESLIWEFEQTRYENDERIISNKLIIEAHSGKVVGRRQDKISVINN